MVADGLAELQVRWPTVPIVFCETRKPAEEWTYRWLAAALTWAQTESAALARIGAVDTGVQDAGHVGGPGPRREPSTADLRSWARAHGYAVPDRGRLRPEIREACNAAQRP